MPYLTKQLDTEIKRYITGYLNLKNQNMIFKDDHHPNPGILYFISQML